MGDFGARLSVLRRQVDADLKKRGLSRRKVTALAVAVLDRTLIRVGSRRYADENDAYGLTTLTSDHVEIDDLHVNWSLPERAVPIISWLSRIAGWLP